MFDNVTLTRPSGTNSYSTRTGYLYDFSIENLHTYIVAIVKITYPMLVSE